MIPLTILSGAGTLASLLLAFFAPSCVLCDFLRLISLAVFVLCVVRLRRTDESFTKAIGLMIASGLLVSGYAHLSATGTVGCPVGCKKIEWGGIDVRSFSFAYFGALGLTELTRLRRSATEMIGLSLAIVTLFAVGFWGGSNRREGEVSGMEGAYLFVDSGCARCREVLKLQGADLLTQGVQTFLLDDEQVQLQVYSTTANVPRLLSLYAASSESDVFEFCRHYEDREIDVRRGQTMVATTRNLWERLKIPVLPYLVVARNGRFAAMGAEEILAGPLKERLRELEKRIGQ